MKIHEEFALDQPVEVIWSFFDDPERVVRCIPGVEEISVLDPDHLFVRATERVGPMSATFDATVTVLERKPKELVRFQAVGKSIRGALGNLRSTNTVRLLAAGQATSVILDADLALAGALGSVGQKIVAKQAGKVSEEFASNLERSLRGEDPYRRAKEVKSESTTNVTWLQRTLAGSSRRPLLVYLSLGASGAALVTSVAALVRARRASLR